MDLFIAKGGFHFSITPVTLIIFIIWLVAGITMFLAYKTSKDSVFSKLLVWILLFVFCHSMYIFIVEVWFINDQWKDRMAPFSLMYGPFLYFGTLAVKYLKLSWKTILLHMLPFICYSVYFILLLTELVPSTIENQQVLRSQLLILNPISFGGYTIWSVIVGRNVFLSKFKGKVLLFVFSRILFLLATMLSLAVLFSKSITGNDEAVLLIRMTMYICMLLAVLAILNFTINKLLARKAGKDVVADTEEKQLPRYERSALTDDQLNIYELKLQHTVLGEQLFLDKNLSLTSLAQHLRIPNHHLTQVFNTRIKQTFYQYINSLRIDHACKLIERYPKGVTMERLAEDCGFNSKVSFNRHFKAQINCTPSVYKSRL